MKTLAATLLLTIIATSAIAEKSDEKDSLVASSYVGSSSYSIPQKYSRPATQPYPAPVPQTFSAQNIQQQSAPASQLYSTPQQSSFSAPATQSFSAPTQQHFFAPSVQPYSGQTAPVSFSPPPCPTNYIISCQPNLKPVSCSHSIPYGSVGAYSQFVPRYIVPSAGLDY